jgi:hypothetical protein
MGKAMLSRKSTVFWLSCAVIFGVALFVRFFQLGHVPYSLYWDEMAMYVDVKSVLQTGKDMFGRPWFQVMYPSYGDYKLPVLIWLATLSSKIFGLSEFSLRLPSALAGVGTVIFGGLIAQELLDQKVKKNEKVWSWSELTQLATMAVIAVSPWSVMFSRTAFEGHVGQFLLAVSIWCLLRSRKQSWLLWLCPLFGAFATYTYFSVRFVWVVVFGLTSLLMISRELGVGKQKVNLKKIILPFTKFSLIKIILPLVLFGVFLIPMLRSPLYKDSNQFRLGTDSILKNEEQVIQSNVYREMAGNTPIDRIIFHRWWLTTQELLKNYSDHLSLNFLFVSGDPNLRHGTGQYGLFVLPLLLPFLVGLYVLARRRPGVLVVLFGWWMVALLPASVPQNTPHALRSLNALVPLAVIIGVGVTEMLLWLRTAQKKSAYVAIASVSMYFILVFVFSFSFLYHYFTVYPKESATDWQNGYTQLARQLAGYGADTKLYVAPFDDRFYLWMMGYGQYTGKDFQSWQSKEYKFEQAIPQTTFKLPSAAEVQATQHIVIAGRPDEMKSLLAQPVLSQRQVSTKEIYGDDGQLRFIVAEFR